MWRKKTKSEIEFDKVENLKIRRKNYIEDCLYFSIKVLIILIIINLIMFLAYGIDAPIAPGAKYDPIPLYKIPNHLIELFELPLIGGILFFIIKIVEGKRNDYFKKSSIIMCDKCFNSKNYDKKMNCECGGYFSTLDNFEWIKED